MLIKGANLTANQIKLVKAAFIYRWTTENGQRESAWANSEGKPTIPLQSDDEWIKEHAFYFVKDGSRLMLNKHHAEPHYMAD
jgi:hypothetical protein